MEACVSLGYYVNLIRDDGKEFTFALSLKGINSILKFLINNIKIVNRVHKSATCL